MIEIEIIVRQRGAENTRPVGKPGHKVLTFDEMPNTSLKARKRIAVLMAEHARMHIAALMAEHERQTESNDA